jgi:hypothetical protein
MSEFFVHDGKQYRLVNRKAEVGEKVIDLFDEGKILTIIEPPYNCGKEWYSFKTESGTDIAPIGQSEYAVLEPLKPSLSELCAKITPENRHEEVTVDTSQASEQVIEMFTALSRKIVSLERQLADTQRNVERQAEELENARHRNATKFAIVEDRIEMLTDDIVTLDSRSQVLNAINKYYAEGSR